MDLQEYIKQLVQQELDEMSVSGDAGGYLSANAFSPKGQKTNAATKTAKSQGMTLAPKGMPSDSKVYDYKSFFTLIFPKNDLNKPKRSPSKTIAKEYHIVRKVSNLLQIMA